MATIRWDPLGDTHLLQRSMNRLFEDTFWIGGESFLKAASWIPVDIKECPEQQQMVVKAEITGLKSGDIKAKADRIRAGYRDGVLEIVLPKEEKAKPGGIEVGSD